MEPVEVIADVVLSVLRVLRAFTWRFFLVVSAIPFVVILLPHKVEAWLESGQIGPWWNVACIIGGFTWTVVWPAYYIVKLILTKD